MNAAPPLALGDLERTGERGVGAHQAHLNDAKLGRKVSCVECHIVPDALNAPGHIDTPWPAEVKWGPLSKTGTVAPEWNAETLTCTNVYCHGATLGGGTHTVPLWTLVDGTQIACGSCHATPPAPPHPEESNCGDCHAPTAGIGATIANPETHIDGRVQVAAATPCGGCHGDGTNLAPPPDAMGRVETTVRSVGAHRAHTSGGRFSRAVDCSDCHVVPEGVSDPGHIDETPAEVQFGGVATREGAAPAYGGDGTCASTYCHSSGGRGGSVPAPNWTTVDGTQAACGACHGLPPPSPHPQSQSCGCHGSVAGPGLTIRDPSKHVDGALQF